MESKLKVIYKSTEFMADTPAAVSREDGVLYINPDIFFGLSKFEQRFITLHEYGHYNLNTSDELAADRYAFERLVGTEKYSINQMGELLQDKILDPTQPGHMIRIRQLRMLAEQWLKANPDSMTNKDIESQKQTADFVMQMYDGFAEMTQAYNQGLLNSSNTMVIGMIGLAVVMMLVLTQDS